MFNSQLKAQGHIGNSEIAIISKALKFFQKLGNFWPLDSGGLWISIKNEWKYNFERLRIGQTPVSIS